MSFFNNSDVRLLVRGQSRDELLGFLEEVGGGSDGRVLFVDGRERPGGQVQAVHARDYVPPGCRNVTIGELVVV